MTSTAKLNGGSYDELTAYWCAVLSDLAYADEPEIRAGCQRYGGQLRDFWSIGNAQGFAAEFDGVLVVSVRGTTPTELRDLVSDARIAQAEGPFQITDKVHRGFLAYAEQLQPYVADVVKHAADAGLQVILCGHSLGAAAVQLLAAGLLHELQRVDAVYTYGSPRVGNAYFCGILDYTLARAGAFHWRHVNACDFFTRVPWRRGKYRHGGLCKFYTRGGRLLPGVTPVWRVAASRIVTFCLSVWTWARRSLADHGRENYRQLAARVIWN